MRNIVECVKMGSKSRQKKEKEDSGVYEEVKKRENKPASWEYMMMREKRGEVCGSLSFI